MQNAEPLNRTNYIPPQNKTPYQTIGLGALLVRFGACHLPYCGVGPEGGKLPRGRAFKAHHPGRLHVGSLFFPRSARENIWWTFLPRTRTTSVGGSTRYTGVVARGTSMRSPTTEAGDRLGALPLHDVGQVWRKLQNDGASTTLLVPLWESSTWWILFVPDAAHFFEAVVDWVWLPRSEANLFVPGTTPCERDVIRPDRKVMAVRVNFLAGARFRRIFLRNRSVHGGRSVCRSRTWHR
jgi:hypothetical protein